MLQAVAAGWYHKSKEQLKEIGDRVGRERIMVIHGTGDQMINVELGKKLIEWLEPETSVVRRVRDMCLCWRRFSFIMIWLRR